MTDGHDLSMVRNDIDSIAARLLSIRRTGQHLGNRVDVATTLTHDPCE